MSQLRPPKKSQMRQVASASYDRQTRYFIGIPYPALVLYPHFSVLYWIYLPSHPLSRAYSPLRTSGRNQTRMYVFERSPPGGRNSTLMARICPYCLSSWLAFLYKCFKNYESVWENQPIPRRSDGCSDGHPKTTALECTNTRATNVKSQEFIKVDRVESSGRKRSRE